MQLKKLSLSSLSLLGISLSLLVSCATVPDVPVCVEVTLDRGYCVHTISDKEFWVDDIAKFEGKTWWEMRPILVMMPASSWAKVKAFILQVCKDRGDCAENVGEWKAKLDRFDAHLGLN